MKKTKRFPPGWKDADKVAARRAWLLDWFKQHPAATVHDGMKAAREKFGIGVGWTPASEVRDEAAGRKPKPKPAAPKPALTSERETIAAIAEMARENLPHLDRLVLTFTPTGVEVEYEVRRKEKMSL